MNAKQSRSTKSGGLRLRALTAILLTILLLTLSLVSCAKSGEDGRNEAPSVGGSDASGKLEDFFSGSETDTESRKIIKTVHETVTTENYDDFITALKAAVTAANGYVSSSAYNGSKESTAARSATFEIRIPAEGLDGFTGEVGELGTVTSYKETQDDISVAYVDVQSRIAVLKAEETALLEILANATYTSEMLEIRAHLEDVMSELASLEAQMRVYNDRIAYSTVHLSVYEVEREVEPVKENFFTKLGAAFLESLDGTLRFLEKLALFFLGGAPYFVLLGVISLLVFLPIYLPKRRRARRNEREGKK